MKNIENYIEYNSFLSMTNGITSISSDTLTDIYGDFIKVLDNSIFIDSSFIDTQTKLYKDSKSIKELVKVLSKLFLSRATKSQRLLTTDLLKKNYKVYQIPLFSKDNFISYDDYENISKHLPLTIATSPHVVIFSKRKYLLSLFFHLINSKYIIASNYVY